MGEFDRLKAQKDAIVAREKAKPLTGDELKRIAKSHAWRNHYNWEAIAQELNLRRTTIADGGNEQ